MSVERRALNVETVQERLATRYMGRNLIFQAETGSTNQDARNLAVAGAPEGTLVVADYQNQGRGRFDRRWEAPAGSSLLMSLLFRPSLAPAQIQRLTMICGLALVEAIEAELGLRAGLKWPNDLVIEGKKAAGMLAETGLTGNRLDFVVVGIGLNVNLDKAQLPAGLSSPAISLSEATGHFVERESLLCAILQAVERRYDGVRAGCSPAAEWAARLVTLGQQVRVSDRDETLLGLAESVDDDGALWLRSDEGRLHRVLAGDVTLRAR